MNDYYPFEVGKDYVNSLGLFEVIQISPPFLIVKFTDGDNIGKVRKLDLIIQSKIMNNRKEKLQTVNKMEIQILANAITKIYYQRDDFNKLYEELVNKIVWYMENNYQCDINKSALIYVVSKHLDKKINLIEQYMISHELPTVQHRIATIRKSIIVGKQEQHTSLVSESMALLVETRIRFCVLLKHREPNELEVIRKYYEFVIYYEEFDEGKYFNRCWACKTPVNYETNDKCSCSWVICCCGACQCPDYANGLQANQEECKVQIMRLGKEQYEVLVAVRQNGGYILNQFVERPEIRIKYDAIFAEVQRDKYNFGEGKVRS